jgi:F-type H+-transporting ATPase subunit gamma
MPSPAIVLHQVVPNYVKGLLYGAMIEAYASEQNARMTAMDNATTNAEEIIRDLTLLYNRVRQAAITTELNEVVSGAAAQE